MFSKHSGKFLTRNTGKKKIQVGFLLLLLLHLIQKGLVVVNAVSGLDFILNYLFKVFI